MDSILLKECIQAKAENDWPKVSEIATKALNSSEVDSMTMVNIGIAVRDSKDFALSDRIFLAIIATDNQFRYAYYEIAFSYMLQGRHTDCVSVLHKFLKHWPHDTRVIALHCKALYLVGAKSEAEALIERISTSTSNVGSFSLIKSFGDFVTDIPIGRMRVLINSVLDHTPMLDASIVQRRILSAKHQGLPFSLVRLGDGEGSCIRINMLDELRYGPLYKDNREQFTRYWFGSDFDKVQEDFDHISSDLRSVVREADIVGLPLPGWLEHEYLIGSSRGISTLVNLYRFIQKMQSEEINVSCCSQSVHIELGKSDLFGKLIGGESKIGLISCFSELPEHIRRNFNVREVEFYKLPGEQYFRDTIGSEAAEGKHFPDVFEKVMVQLKRDQSKKIFLVAGGILGKFYIQQIKRSGGIALDIGSLADIWMNKVTRPGYEKLAALAL